MKKSMLFLLGALALAFGLSFSSTAAACDKGDGHCDCAKKAQAAADAAKPTQVALEGRVESFGCAMEAAKMECTGAALVVGDQKHLIKKGKKGVELVKKAKGSDKLVKVSGTQQGQFLTVASYSIKG